MEKADTGTWRVRGALTPMDSETAQHTEVEEPGGCRGLGEGGSGKWETVKGNEASVMPDE